MKTGTRLFALAVLTLISTWGLSGCRKQEPVAITEADPPTQQMGDHDEHARHHGEAKAGRHEKPAHGGHDAHKHHGHTKAEHKHPKHGGHHDEAAPHGGVKVGARVPDFTVHTLDGKDIKLSELRKEAERSKSGVVVLSFWCSTCHSCRDVERQLAKLSKDYDGQVAVIALDANADETSERVAAFVKKSGLALPVVLDPSGKTADLFGVRRTTTTVVIDGDGVLRYCGQFRQKAGGGSAEDALRAVLAGKEVAVKTTPHNG